MKCRSKLQAPSYLDILNAGGGILNTLTNTRKATEDELFERGRGFLAEMLDFGVTTVEIKSGYGLDSENELKQLRVIRRLGGACAQDIAATFLGAHAIPDEYAGNADGYIDFIIERVCRSLRTGACGFLRCLPRKFRIQRSAVAETSACGTKTRASVKSACG